MRTMLFVSAFMMALFGGQSALAADAAKAAKATPAAHKNASAEAVFVKMDTNKGTIILQLDPVKAPISVKNFLSYIKTGHYDGTIFHRVIRDFMIQGGGFDQNMIQKATQAPIKNEADNGLGNERGSIAMARTSVVDSATSQFFINVKNNTFLNNGARDFGYAVFGKVTHGMKVVDSIATSATGYRDIPVDNVIIEKMSVISAEQASAVK